MKNSNFIDEDILKLVERDTEKWLDASSKGFKVSKEYFIDFCFKWSLEYSWSFCEMICLQALRLIHEKRLVVSSDGKRLTVFFDVKI